VPIVCNDGVTIAKEFDLKDPDIEPLLKPLLRASYRYLVSVTM
jgi:hypothetical protein